MKDILPRESLFLFFLLCSVKSKMGGNGYGSKLQNVFLILHKNDKNMGSCVKQLPIPLLTVI